MKIGYSKTYPIIGKEQWEKIWIEDEVTGTEEDARKALYALKRQVESFHYESNKAAEKVEKENSIPDVDPKWEDIKKIIEGIEFYEDAEQYINTTEYRMAFEAKKLLSQKPRKK